MSDKMKYVKGGGESCAVHGCCSNRRRIYLWNSAICDIHGEKHINCPCLVPFSLHVLPSKDAECRLKWQSALNRKSLPKRVFVCSKHFVDGRPTKENPVPTLNLGYKSMLKPGRRILKRKYGEQCSSVAEESSNDSENILSNEMESNFHNLDISTGTQTDTCQVKDQIVPVSCVHKFDDILVVCAALVNLGTDLIKDNMDEEEVISE